jgi:hypothetical protein
MCFKDLSLFEGIYLKLLANGIGWRGLLIYNFSF